MQSIIFNDNAITPSKIVCVGRNYVAHIEELGNEIPDNMVVFNKPNSAITDILRSQMAGQALHYEAELAFMIKKVVDEVFQIPFIGRITIDKPF